MKTSDTLVALAIQFTSLSLVAFGGANAVIPEIHRQAVDVNHWMTNQDFAALFAIAQSAPGPNFLISTLVGWKAAGIPGALIATAAMCAPSCLLTFWAVKSWLVIQWFTSTAWRRISGITALAPPNATSERPTNWTASAASVSAVFIGATGARPPPRRC